MDAVRSLLKLLFILSVLTFIQKKTTNIYAGKYSNRILVATLSTSRLEVIEREVNHPPFSKTCETLARRARSDSSSKTYQTSNKMYQRLYL